MILIVGKLRNMVPMLQLALMSSLHLLDVRPWRGDSNNRCEFPLRAFIFFHLGVGDLPGGSPVDKFVIEWLKRAYSVNLDGFITFIVSRVSFVVVCKLIFFGSP